MKELINKNKVKVPQSKFKLSNGSYTTDKRAISENFNNFLISVGQTLARKIPHQQMPPECYLGPQLLQTIYLSPASENEIKEIVLSLKKSAPGNDDMIADILKIYVDIVKSPVAYICNLSIVQGVFPEELKTANVLPLYKADDPMLFNNYRPVSLLTVLSKVFEKIMYNRLLNFLDTYDILFKNQFGFRKNHSTYMAMMLLMEEITKSLENGEYVIGIFLDFSKAFDTVDHDILLRKLYHYGIRGNALQWFESYLKNRKQFVTYNGVSSDTKLITCGVPQGSILGPLLFLIYINDLSLVCDRLISILFADDTNMFMSSKDVHSLQTVINQELTLVSKWLKVNKLSLNIKKTHFMIFSNKSDVCGQIDIKIDGEPIQAVGKTKFLGVIIDKNLTWKDHILCVSGKIARGLGMIIKARKYLNKAALMSLYYSFIYPYLTYCNQIWGTAYPTHQTKLIVIQKKAVRIIAGAKYRAPTDALFSDLGILKFVDVNIYFTMLFMFRVHNNMVPDQFQMMFNYNRDIHPYVTRQSNHLHIPMAKTNLGKKCIKYQGSVIWNKVIKLNIPTDTSEAVFKRSVKKEIIRGVWLFISE